MTPQSFIRAGQFVVGVGIARLLSALLLLPQSLRVPSSGGHLIIPGISYAKEQRIALGSPKRAVALLHN
jgi:hypothetical protein